MPFKVARMYEADWPEHVAWPATDGRGSGERPTPGVWNVGATEYATYREARDAIFGDLKLEMDYQHVEDWPDNQGTGGKSIFEFTEAVTGTPGTHARIRLSMHDGSHLVWWEVREVPDP